MSYSNQSLAVGPGVAQLGAFLRSRRARLTPSEVGLSDSRRRRTTGLRREEVAQLAGISPAWYTHLEQGRDVRPSREVLDALADALRLEAGERAYLLHLADTGRRAGDRRAMATAIPPAASLGRPTSWVPVAPSPSLRRLLDALGPTPALVINCCWDVVSCNPAFAAVLPDFGPFALGERGGDLHPLNVVEYALTNADWRAAMHDWPRVARTAVDGLRADLAGVTPNDPMRVRAAALVACLSDRSPEFRAWWPAHGLWVADQATSHVFEHPSVGTLDLDVTLLDVRSAPGLTLLTYVPHDSTTSERLRHLLCAANQDGAG